MVEGPVLLILPVIPVSGSHVQGDMTKYVPVLSLWPSALVTHGGKDAPDSGFPDLQSACDRVHLHPAKRDCTHVFSQ